MRRWLLGVALCGWGFIGCDGAGEDPGHPASGADDSGHADSDERDERDPSDPSDPNDPVDTDVEPAPAFELGGVTISPSQVFNDTTLMCEAELLDPSAQLVALRYAWVNVPSGDTLADAASLTLTPALAVPGDVLRCEVEAEAANGTIVTDSGEVEVDARPPEIVAVTLVPAVPALGDAVTCEVETLHPDAATPEDIPLDLSFAWVRVSNGDVLGDAATLTLDAEAVDAGDAVRCDVTVSDGALEVDGTAAATVRSAAEVLPVSQIGNLRFVPAGTFVMGCMPGRDDVDADCTTNEGPHHDVTLTRAYWIMESSVTRQMWHDVMGLTPSDLSACPTCPMQFISWTEATLFANEMSIAEGLDACYTPSGSCSNTLGSNYFCTGFNVNTPGQNPYLCEGYRLPTEAEFERAARGLQDFAYPGSNTPEDVMWFGANSGGSVQPVCTRARNGLQLCDMGGNGFQFTHDSGVAASNPYSGQPRTDPFSFPSTGLVSRMLRSRSHAATNLAQIRISRQASSSGLRQPTQGTGFRLVRIAQPDD